MLNLGKAADMFGIAAEMLTLPRMGLLRDAQIWGGAERPPYFFLGNYILYGVLVFIFMYIPINHVCMAIFRLHRFPGAMTSFLVKMTSVWPK